MLEALDLRDVRMPVDDSGAVLEPGREPRFATVAWPGVVHHPDLHAVHLDDAVSRQCLLEGRLVHVSGDAGERWPEGSEVLVELCRDEVSGVQDEIGTDNQPYAFIGKDACPAREVRVGDDSDASQEAVIGSGTPTRGSCRN